MNTKEAYEQKLKAQLDEMSAELKKLEAKDRKLRTQARKEGHTTVLSVRPPTDPSTS